MRHSQKLTPDEAGKVMDRMLGTPPECFRLDTALAAKDLRARAEHGTHVLISATFALALAHHLERGEGA